ncbi:hypothetical protein MFU01_77420 [Myxococcus fulvus]|uniref:Lipoprotein n=2 Tax=Myxococcus fulvus TaxID=33 RepID=A0A511TEU9_MYXFU|nr:hypothetical protein [Myxococcus fulvus]GEN12705.1 hypothetical protein MFU01_77420 [Myxococcus fulvus]
MKTHVTIASLSLMFGLVGCGPEVEMDATQAPTTQEPVSVPAAEELDTAAQAINPGCRDPQVYWPYGVINSNGTVNNGWAGNLIQSSEDRVFFTYSGAGAAPSNVVRITLTAAANITWWKGIEVFRPDGSRHPSVLETHNSGRGPYTMDIVVNNTDSPNLWAIKFLKGKLFGIHTGMYCLEDLSAWRGRNLYFTWTYDAS